MDQRQIEMERDTVLQSVPNEMTKPEKHRLIMIQATEHGKEYGDRQNCSVGPDRQ